jgi:hypothetical protein
MNQTIVKVLKINKYILCLMSKKTIYNKKFFIILSSLLFVVLIALFLSQVMRREGYLHFDSFDTEDNDWLFDLEANSQWFPNGVIGDNVTGYHNFIVPNIVHYVLLNDNQINFVHYLSFKSVLNIQKPDKVMIHCNCDHIEGHHWNQLNNEFKDFQNKVMIRKIERPALIFGVKFNNIWHESDIIRNKVCICDKKSDFN